MKLFQIILKIFSKTNTWQLWSQVDVFCTNLLAFPNFPPSIISLLMLKRKTVLEGSVLLMFTKDKLQRKAGEMDIHDKM